MKQPRLVRVCSLTSDCAIGVILVLFVVWVATLSVMT